MDDENQKIVRELQRKKSNKQCMECGERGPGYVCTNFNTFVCTSCSGILREFNFRVKSISMSTFTTEEVEGLRKGGNARARKRYLAEFEDDSMLPESGERRRIKEFIEAKYIDLRYVKGASDAFKKKSKKKTTQSQKVNADAVRNSSVKQKGKSKKTKKKISKGNSSVGTKISIDISRISQPVKENQSQQNELDLLDFAFGSPSVPEPVNERVSLSETGMNRESSDDIWGEFQTTSPASPQLSPLTKPETLTTVAANFSEPIPSSDKNETALDDPFASLSISNDTALTMDALPQAHIAAGSSESAADAGINAVLPSSPTNTLNIPSQSAMGLSRNTQSIIPMDGLENLVTQETFQTSGDILSLQHAAMDPVSLGEQNMTQNSQSQNTGMRLDPAETPANASMSQVGVRMSHEVGGNQFMVNSADQQNLNAFHSLPKAENKDKDFNPFDMF